MQKNSPPVMLLGLDKSLALAHTTRSLLKDLPVIIIDEKELAMKHKEKYSAGLALISALWGRGIGFGHHRKEPRKITPQERENQKLTMAKAEKKRDRKYEKLCNHFATCNAEQGRLKAGAPFHERCDFYNKDWKAQ